MSLSLAHMAYWTFKRGPYWGYSLFLAIWDCSKPAIISTKIKIPFARIVFDLMHGKFLRK
jgi:hypothetical protein